MGGDHHHSHPPIPDWKIYKVSEKTPELIRVQQELASYGLKDPWIRNEVWRFDRTKIGTIGSNARILFFRGFKYGLAAALLHYGIKQLISKDEGHGHH